MVTRPRSSRAPIAMVAFMAISGHGTATARPRAGLRRAAGRSLRARRGQEFRHW